PLPTNGQRRETARYSRSYGGRWKNEPRKIAKNVASSEHSIGFSARLISGLVLSKRWLLLSRSRLKMTLRFMLSTFVRQSSFRSGERLPPTSPRSRLLENGSRK